MATNLQIFFTQHPLFYLDELRKKFQHLYSESTLNNLLQYHLKKGHLKRIKYGLYAHVAPGDNPNKTLVDEYLIGSKLAKDSVIGYQSALGYWGTLYSIRNEIIYLTNEDVSKRKYFFDGVLYRAVAFPLKLVQHKQEQFDVQSVNRLGERILVTSLERTFVDILDRFDLIKSWEEVYRAFQSIGSLKLERVIEYAKLLENATTIAKVGFFLEIFREYWHVNDAHLNELKKYIPKTNVYIDRKSKKARKLIPQWNIIVPESLLTREWEEPHEDI